VARVGPFKKKRMSCLVLKTSSVSQASFRLSERALSRTRFVTKRLFCPESKSIEENLEMGKSEKKSFFLRLKILFSSKVF